MKLLKRLSAIIVAAFCSTFSFMMSGRELYEDVLIPGDLLFVAAGDSEMSSAIADATSAPDDTARYEHVAMLGRNGMVIEAEPHQGVRKISLKAWICEQNNKRIVAKRLMTEFPADSAIARAELLVGRNYDWRYLPDNDDFYCSELIHECYRDNNGKHIFPTQPMNFANPDGSLPKFWIDVFAELGMEVPQGVAGTNPTDMSKFPHLHTLMIISEEKPMSY